MSITVDVHARHEKEKLSIEVNQFNRVSGTPDFVTLRFLQDGKDGMGTHQVTIFLNDLGEVVKMAAEILKLVGEAARTPYDVNSTRSL